MNAAPMTRKLLNLIVEQVRPAFVQAAALCLRDGPRGPEVLLIRTLRLKQWIIPKGWPMKGKTLAEAAAIEAWEEAGVVGKAEESPIGFYTYEKKRAGGVPVSCRVEVFRLHVADLAKDWPERSRRKRKWMTLDKAAAAVDEVELKTLLLSL